jgi:hypothetical protein
MGDGGKQTLGKVGGWQGPKARRTQPYVVSSFRRMLELSNPKPGHVRWAHPRIGVRIRFEGLKRSKHFMGARQVSLRAPGNQLPDCPATLPGFLARV